MDKKELRAAVRARSALLTADDRAEASSRIARQVLASKAFAEAQTVFIYLSMPSEPDTAAIIRAALQDGKTLLVPKCRAHGQMIAVELREETALFPGAYGIPEPAGDCPYEGQIDLAVVPCVSASRNGRRLGHGAGYYDRFLAERRPHTLCLCFSQLLSDDIPTDEYDILMDEVITE